MKEEEEEEYVASGRRREGAAAGGGERKSTKLRNVEERIISVCACLCARGREASVLYYSEDEGTMNHSRDKWVKIKRDKSRSDCVAAVNCIFYWSGGSGGARRRREGQK